jgi:4-hydroxythreonine-4-phosphate dehydrogenase
MYDTGFAFPGQTEFFAARCGVEDFAMLLTGGGLTVALVTTHIPLHTVAAALTQQEIVRVGLLLSRFLTHRLQRSPRIAVAGLNPHAGESGAIGSEETETIRPAVEELQLTLGGAAIVDGPFSPDTIFHRAVSGEWDGVLCMYHDQGLIPLKLHAFHDGVNVTLGLPFPRTSPDHGHRVRDRRQRHRATRQHDRRADTRRGTHRTTIMTSALPKYVAVFKLGLQNTFVYRWNYLLARLSSG